MSKRRLAVIGNGMGTCRLLDELALRGATDAFEITVFGEERGGAYNRILLGRVLAGEEPNAIVTKTADWYDRHNVRLVERTRVTRLDTARKTVESADGQSRRYDLAVLATGSQPLVPPLDGMNGPDGELRDGIFVYRTIADCLRIRNHARPGDAAVVLGGGLLGLEAAKALSDRGLHVTVIQVSERLMNAQLDTIGGEMLRRQIERHGIFVRAGRTVEAVSGDEELTGVVLDDGTRLPASLIVLACGVRPRVEVARASGIPVNKGIVVNDALATEVPGVYAFGECAEHQGKTYGIVGPVWEHASVLSDVLSGKNPGARYRGSKIYTRLKVAGVDVACLGQVEPELESDEVIQVVEERKSAYRKLIVRGDRLVGAMLVGQTSAAASLIQLYDRDDPLPADPLEILCPGAGSAAAPAERVVCNCHRVTDAALKTAIASGADSVEALGAATRAGTGCGSCRGELAELVRKHAPPSRPLLAAG
ncbi:MAG TPA: FAD-dependent oxidoreductase [Polyangiaceae bacterium]